MDKAFLFALTAAINPVLLGATTVMLMLERPKRLMLGYWLGAMTTGNVVGVSIVLWMGSSGVSTAQRTAAPGVDFALGAILLLAGSVIRRRSSPEGQERRAEKLAGRPRKTPKWQQKLSTGTARTTFVVGLLLSFPGASYLASLTEIHKQGFSAGADIVAVLSVNLVMLVLLEAPLVAYTIAPDWTPGKVEQMKDWLSRSGAKALAATVTVLGAALIVRAVFELVF